MRIIFLACFVLSFVLGCSSNNSDLLTPKDLEFIQEQKTLAFPEFTPMETMLLLNLHGRDFFQSKKKDEEVCAWQSLIKKKIISGEVPPSSPDFVPQFETEKYRSLLDEHNVNRRKLLSFYHYFQSVYSYTPKDWSDEEFEDLGYVTISGPVNLNNVGMGQKDDFGNDILSNKITMTEKGRAVAGELFRCPKPAWLFFVP